MQTDELEPTLDLIRCLSCEEWRSGEWVASQLSLSRAAVWKRIRKLTDIGVSVERNKKRGYRLSKRLELLDVGLIASRLDRLLEAPPKVALSPVCDSTNTRLLERVRCGDGAAASVLLAEMQTAGRGRRGRNWTSPFGRNVYLSYSWRCERGVSGLSGLSLAAGVMVAEAISSSTGLAVMLKWPNDLLIGSAKCGGILIDVDGDLEGAVDVVIGVGLNVDMEGFEALAVNQPWTDLNSHLQVPVSRNELAALVIAALCSGLSRFREAGFAEFRNRWLMRDALAGKEVSVSTPGKIVSGTEIGVSPTGGLLVSVGGDTIEVNSGDASLRLQ